MSYLPLAYNHPKKNLLVYDLKWFGGHVWDIAGEAFRACLGPRIVFGGLCQFVDSFREAFGGFTEYKKRTKSIQTDEPHEQIIDKTYSNTIPPHFDLNGRV